jgi:hypothetical protein
MANDVIYNQAISFRALGVLVYLLSKPDGWETDSERLANGRKEGRDAIRTAFKEMESAGYLIRKKIQDAVTGRWSTVGELTDNPPADTSEDDQDLTSEDSDRPQLAPTTGFQASGKPPPRKRVSSRRRDQGKHPKTAGPPDDWKTDAWKPVASSKNGDQGLQEPQMGAPPPPSPPRPERTQAPTRTDRIDPLTAVPDLNDTKQVTSRPRARNETVDRPLMTVILNECGECGAILDPDGTCLRCTTWTGMTPTIQRLTQPPSPEAIGASS